MKKSALLCLILCLALLLQCPAAAADEPEDTTGAGETYSADLSVTNGSNTMDAQVPLDGMTKKLSTAKAVVLYEMSTDTLLYAYNADGRVYPASLVKLMTALVALEQGNLTDQVTVTNAMLNSMAADDIKTSLKEGEVYTLQDLIYWMLVSSSNDASVIIAYHIAGGHEGMAALMNQRAAQIGCTGTNFTNAHGFSDTEQYTTARDMGKILLEALKNEDFVAAFSAPTYTIAANGVSAERTLKTTNYFISTDVVKKFYDARVTGGKSGAVNINDRSLVVTAESGSMQLLGIVMGAKGETEEDGYSMKWYGNFEEMEELLHYGFDNFKAAQILSSDRSMQQFTVLNGANDVTGRPVSDGFSALPSAVGTNDLSWRFELDETLTAPVTAGDRIGTVQVWYGNVCVAQSDMVAMNSARVKGETQQTDTTRKDTDGSMLAFVKTLGIIFGALAVLFGLYYLYNLIRRSIIRRRRNKRRRSRRRSR